VLAETARIVLITGVDNSFDFEVARQLGEGGAEVLLGARSPELGEVVAAAVRAEVRRARFIHLDVGDLETIRDAAVLIEAEYGRLDVLVNNLGITDKDDGPPGTARIDAVRRIFETNVFGALAVTQAMLPLLLKSSSARIVNVSSGLGSITPNADAGQEHAQEKLFGYSAAKAALTILTEQLAAELKDRGAKVNSVDPLHAATDLKGHQTVSEGALAVVRYALLPDDGPTGCIFSAERREPL
jgi:NAD(P)-dependent dehydrogenase (short-subunit alcohol dehydrogenase family)